MLALALIALGVLSRFLFHIDNFTPVLAIALFAGVYLSKRNALLVPLALFIVSDMILGFHPTILFTWGSVLLIACVGWQVKSKKSAGSIALGSLASAVLFFMVTNFGVWLMTSLYPKTAVGFAECFMAAVPFFRFTLASTLMYVVVLFGLYELAALKLRKTKLAYVL